ncbi:MAG: hypothetical protein JWP25_7056 [Bradyrhizobium sp.]|nr:hypothetical protein [Bradyrhizobium sp.]MEA2865726.1 uncharacterized protein [Bradyrhizobium sp.]
MTRNTFSSTGSKEPSLNWFDRIGRRRLLTFATVAALHAVADSQPAFAANDAGVTAANKRKVEAALTAWKNGTGNIADLLSDDIRWTIVGNTPASGTFVGKTDLLEKVLKPFGARFSASADKFRPIAIKGIYGDGDIVVAFFDGKGTANDGKPYANTYAWFLRLKDGLVVDATAFFDSMAFNELWSRVKPIL